MWICPKCKEEHEDNFDCCWKCQTERGTAQEISNDTSSNSKTINISNAHKKSKSFCMNCGAALKNSSKYCSDCGTPVQKNDIQQPRERSGNSENIGSVCSWCAKKMSSAALKCPHCGKWRKDISNERVICYCLCAFSTIFIIGALNKSRSIWDGGIIFSALFSSVWFWLFVLTAIPGCYYYYKVSNKIGTWWWF